MLLFLLRDDLREAPYAPRPAKPTKGGYAAELIASGLFVSAWCVLRLLSAHGDNFTVDRALALPCLALALWVVLRSFQSLELGAVRRRPGNKSLTVKRA